MPEPSILLCGPALDADQSAASLDVLRRINLPNATKFLVTTGKFDAEGDAKTVNVEADYPAETAYLRTLLGWAEVGGLEDPRFRDGYDIYCLRRILARFKKFTHAVILREGAASIEQRWTELQQGVEGRLFQTFDDVGGGTTRPSLLIDLRDERSARFLDAAWELYRTGAVYGMASYSIEGALRIAVETIELEQAFRQPIEAESTAVPESVDTQDVVPEPAAAVLSE